MSANPRTLCLTTAQAIVRRLAKIGTPSLSQRAEVQKAHDDVERGGLRQRMGV